MTKSDRDSSSAIHDRLFQTMMLGIGAVIAYVEVRVQLLSDTVNKLEDRFNEHSSQPAHEGAAVSTDLLRDLVFWLMNQIGVESFPASVVPTA